MKLHPPLTQEQILKLKKGDQVEISGLIITARDEGHKHLTSGKVIDPGIIECLSNGVLYHCGPLVRVDKKKKDPSKRYQILSAGPTTSAREDHYMPQIIAQYGLRAIIGKGGMGKETLQACKQHTCVYLQAIGGAACVYAEKIVKVLDVFMLDEFGMPEAFWVLEVKDFPVTVTMDAHGKSLHEEIKKKSYATKI